MQEAGRTASYLPDYYALRKVLITVRSRLGLLLLALLLAGCSTATPTVPPKPEPDATTTPAPASTQPPTTQAPVVTPNPAKPPAQKPAAPTPPDLQERLTKADGLLVAGENRAAAALLLEAVGAHPDSAGAWDLLTLALIRLGEPEAAGRTGERAVQLEPEGATIRFNTGLAYYRANQPLQAALHLREAARLNQVRPEPLIYLALSTSGDEAQAALQELEARFPTEPAVQLVRTSLALGRNDLDEDGKPEVITKANGQLRITNGATGEQYLEIALQSPDVWTYFGLMGTAGDRFLVINDPRGSSFSLYHLEGHRFVPVPEIMRAGMAHFDRATRQLSVAYLDRSTGSMIGWGYDWQDGALVQVYNKVTPSDKGPQPPPEPLKDDVDLLVAVMKWQPRAYLSSTLLQEVVSQDKDKWGLIPFILPTGSGYRLELWNPARPSITARAILNKERQIERLTWE